MPEIERKMSLNERISNLLKHGKKTQFTKGHVAEKNYNWKGGKMLDKDGYVLIRVYDPRPNIPKNGYIREHRLVMEKHLNRFLNKKEQVHHINGNKQDNRIENLKLFANQKEHWDYHWVELRARKFCCPNCKNVFKLEEISHVSS